MTLSRKRLLAAGAATGAFASVGILRWPGDAAQFTLKLANDQTPTHPMNVATTAAIKRIQAASGGQLTITLFPNSALGGDPDMLAQVRSGAIQLLQIGNNILGSLVPAASLLSIPFAFSSVKEYESSATGPLGAYIRDANQKIGLRGFESPFYGGFFEIESSLRPVNAPADLKGMKMRVPPGPIDVDTFRALGATPTVITIGEVYTSLQTHLVDAIEVPLPTVRNFKFYEQVKYGSITNHMPLSYLLVANAQAWSQIPKNLQEILDRELNAAGVVASQSMAQQEVAIQSTLTADGMVFNRPPLEPFREIIRKSGLYGRWREQFDPKAWVELEKTTGKLA